jgi:hypothetical protein
MGLRLLAADHDRNANYKRATTPRPINRPAAPATSVPGILNSIRAGEFAELVFPVDPGAPLDVPLRLDVAPDPLREEAEATLAVLNALKLVSLAILRLELTLGGSRLAVGVIAGNPALVSAEKVWQEDEEPAGCAGGVTGSPW